MVVFSAVAPCPPPPILRTKRLPRLYLPEAEVSVEHESLLTGQVPLEVSIRLIGGRVGPARRENIAD